MQNIETAYNIIRNSHVEALKTMPAHMYTIFELALAGRLPKHGVARLEEVSQRIIEEAKSC